MYKKKESVDFIEKPKKRRRPRVTSVRASKVPGAPDAGGSNEAILSIYFNYTILEGSLGEDVLDAIKSIQISIAEQFPHTEEANLGIPVLLPNNTVSSFQISTTETNVFFCDINEILSEPLNAFFDSISQDLVNVNIHYNIEDDNGNRIEVIDAFSDCIYFPPEE